MPHDDYTDVLIARLMTKVKVTGDHWVYQTGQTLKMADGHQYPLRKAAWLLFKGPVPDGYHVRGTTLDRHCCNPAHCYITRPAPASLEERNRAAQRRWYLRHRWCQRCKEPLPIRNVNTGERTAQFARGLCDRCAATLDVAPTRQLPWDLMPPDTDMPAAHIKVGRDSYLDRITDEIEDDGRWLIDE